MVLILSVRIKKFFCILLIELCILNIFNKVAQAADGVLDEAKDALEDYYIDKIPEKAMEATTMEEMIKYLKDPYTQYFTENEFKEIVNNINMSFFGIGVFIEMDSDGAKVKSVIFNSPASEMGIKPGDVILVVKDKMVKNLTEGEALTLINGEEGTVVSLKVLRRSEILEFNIEPRKIPYATVLGEVLEGHIGYIRIASFGNITPSEFYNTLQELRGEKVNSFIIDLRNNPGGYLYSSLEIAGYFIGNITALTVEDKSGNRINVKPQEFKGRINEPVVFLINDYTASASEVIAAAVKDYNTGLILGTNSYGKGVAQNMFKLSDGSVLKTSTLKFYSPKGRDINYVGISPDIYIDNMDPLMAGILLLDNKNQSLAQHKNVLVSIYDKEYKINLDNIKNKDYWELYRRILSKASSVETFYSIPNEVANNKGLKSPLSIKFEEMPKLIYKEGDRVTFKISVPHYDKAVEYRAILWDDATNTYRDLWNTGDRYYDYWTPLGKDIFTIGLPITSAGNYRIKIFVKRKGVANDKTLLKGFNCDGYICEIPFLVAS